jgi:hypothetical protein
MHRVHCRIATTSFPPPLSVAGHPFSCFGVAELLLPGTPTPSVALG